jgi:hypothetical protein
MPSKPVTEDWYTANHRYLMKLLSQTRRVLEQRIEPEEEGRGGLGAGVFVDVEEGKELSAHPAFEETPPALEQLCQIFGLSSFEREIVLLCAGMEFDRTGVDDVPMHRDSRRGTIQHSVWHYPSPNPPIGAHSLRMPPCGAGD